MKTLLNTVLLGLLLTGASAANAEASYNPGFDVGTIDSWRSGPGDIVKWCDRAVPERAAALDHLLDDWTLRNATLIARVDQDTADVIRIAVPPQPDIDVVQGVKAQFMMARMKTFFLGKPKEETLALCTNFSDPAHIMWGASMVGKVTEALGRLDAWKAQHATTGPASAPGAH